MTPTKLLILLSVILSLSSLNAQSKTTAKSLKPATHVGESSKTCGCSVPPDIIRSACNVPPLCNISLLCDCPPCGLPNMRLYCAYLIIQCFKQTITNPNNITATWKGTGICSDKKSYVGFYCDYPPDSPETLTIASIDFNGFHLAAPTLDGFINKFPDLALFHANSNNFLGTVPDLLGLRYLYELDFSNNKLSGPFPFNVIPLTRLAFLDLRFNYFAGSVPPSVFHIAYEAFFLNNNFLDQGVPFDLGSSPVEYLTFANNEFTGPIPASICNTSNTLIEVLFLNNKFSGCLPYEIGYLKTLTVFDAGTNWLTGQIPLSFGCLKNIEQLNLAQNYLYGEVPNEVCQLAYTRNLVNLSLSDNFFTSIGNICMELVGKKVLDVRGNCITGFQDQKPIEECGSFLSLPKYCPLATIVPCATPSPQLAHPDMPCYNPHDWSFRPSSPWLADYHMGYKQNGKGNGN